MPYKDPEKRRESVRRSMARRYAKQRARAIEHLGGSCVVCGTKESLEFDHIDRETKSFSVGQHLSRRWDDIVSELDKCQLLCTEDHLEKTLEERSGAGSRSAATVS